jgi:plastocyanin
MDEESCGTRVTLSGLVVAVVLLVLSVTTLTVAAIHVSPVEAPTGTPSVVVIVAPNNSGATDINFAPANVLLVIGVNNTIILKNADSADHTITSNSGNSFHFDTGDITGDTSSGPITFANTGSYPYHCQFHPSTMHGTITVVAS